MFEQALLALDARSYTAQTHRELPPFSPEIAVLRPEVTAAVAGLIERTREPGAELANRVVHFSSELSGMGMNFSLVQTARQLHEAGYEIVDYTDPQRVFREPNIDPTSEKPRAVFVLDGDTTPYADLAHLDIPTLDGPETGQAVDATGLKTLSDDPNTVFIFGHVGKHTYPIITWDMRAFDANTVAIAPFTPEQTGEQIDKLTAHGSLDDSPPVSMIHALTGGVPMATAMVVQARDIEQGLRNYLEYIVGRMGADESIKPQLLDYLLSLSVLQHFDDDAIVSMTAGYFVEQNAVTLDRARLVRRALGFSSGYIGTDEHDPWKFSLQPQLRHIAGSYLRMSDGNKLKSMHECAANMYADWAKQYQASDLYSYYQEEELYHRSFGLTH